MAKNAQVAATLLTSSNNLLQQGDIRMCSVCDSFVDDKSFASCQLRLVARSLSKLVISRLVASCFNIRLILTGLMKFKTCWDL